MAAADIVPVPSESLEQTPLASAPDGAGDVPGVRPADDERRVAGLLGRLGE